MCEFTVRGGGCARWLSHSVMLLVRRGRHATRVVRVDQGRRRRVWDRSRPYVARTRVRRRGPRREVVLVAVLGMNPDGGYVMLPNLMRRSDGDGWRDPVTSVFGDSRELCGCGRLVEMCLTHDGLIGVAGIRTSDALTVEGWAHHPYRTTHSRSTGCAPWDPAYRLTPLVTSRCPGRSSGWPILVPRVAHLVSRGAASARPRRSWITLEESRRVHEYRRGWEGMREHVGHVRRSVPGRVRSVAGVGWGGRVFTLQRRSGQSMIARWTRNEETLVNSLEEFIVVRTTLCRRQSRIELRCGVRGQRRRSWYRGLYPCPQWQ